MDGLASLEWLSEWQLTIMLHCADLDQVSKTPSNTLSLSLACMHLPAKQNTVEAKEIICR